MNSFVYRFCKEEAAIPIVRTYACEECGYFTDVTLRFDQADDPPPVCPRCNAYDVREPMRQEFKPVAIGGSAVAKAHKIAETIAHEDYGVADMQREHRPEGVPKHRLKDEGTPAQSSTWGVAGAALEQAIAIGRQTRLQNGGSGLDILQNALKDGTQPDLIEISKRRSMKIW